MDDQFPNRPASKEIGPSAAATADSPPSGGSGATANGRAKTMAGQAVVNRIVRGLLRTPLVCRLLGNRLITVYVVGRKSGRRYTIPVAYTRHQGTLLIGTPFGWGRNLRSGEPVEIRFKGKRRSVEVDVARDEPTVVELYAAMARDNHQFAKFNNIGFDASGDPNPTDLQLAWAGGARAVRLTLD